MPPKETEPIAAVKVDDAEDPTPSPWKDDWAACTRYGICHPSLLNACCCPLILLGQVMTRLKLDWRGDPAPSGEWANTFKIFVYITIGYFIISLLLTPEDPMEPSDLYNFIGFVYFGLCFFVTYKVRSYLRKRDGIAEIRCFGCEDACCAFFCGCCTASQLARQTANYDEDDAYFFTNTGLAPSETVMVV